MASTDDELEKVAAAFDRDTDPLAQYEDQFEQINVDPLDAYIERVQKANGASDSTLKNYLHAFEQWRTFMQAVGRHYACPSDSHVKQFMEHLTEERDNQSATILKKVRNVLRAYEWWQDHHAFPHPTDYNPFRIALRETDVSERRSPSNHPPLSVDDIREVISGCTNVRERLFLVLQLKLGLRVGELLNIQLKDIALTNSNIQQWYPEIGSADPIQGYEDAIYVPSRHERDGNKSHRPRILPLDDETKRTILQYLPTRPMAESPWLVLSKRTFQKLDRGDCVNNIWKNHFSEHNANEKYRNITSHYGRYFFTNFWKVKQGTSRELVQYMRGDKLGDQQSGGAIDEYLAAYYRDIEEIYRTRIFKLL